MRWFMIARDFLVHKSKRDKSAGEHDIMRDGAT